MSDDNYVHDPDAFDGDGERVEAGEADGMAVEADADPEDETQGGLTARQGWLVVGLVAVCFVGFPLLVLFWPPGFLGFKDAYMAAAMVPGLILGLVGLWAVAKGRG